jgi:alpha-mannosidase
MNAGRQKLIGVMLMMVVPFVLPGLARSSTARSSPCGDDGEKVWQVGQFDESSEEFGDAMPPEAPPAYVVGKNGPKDWYAFQPGSANGRFGNRPYPRSLEFNLPSSPTGSYTMCVALMVEHAGIPALQIEINGKTGRFYQHPVLNYSMGDGAAAWFPTYSSSTISLRVPASFLKMGTNRIVFAAIDEHSPGRQLPDAPPWAGDSGIVYDAIALAHESSASHRPEMVTARIEPTIFYRSSNRVLQERVDVFIGNSERSKSAVAELSVGGQVLSQPFVSDRDFGEQRISFDVAEFSGANSAKVTVTFDGQSSRFEQKILPAKKWTLFVVPNEHLDVGYTDFAAKVAEVHSRVIDEAMDLIDKYPNFRFALDGFWEVEQFQNGRSVAETDRLYKMVRDDRILVPPQYASLLTQFAGAETLIRSLYAGNEFHQSHGGTSDYVSITDIPSFSWSYASILAASGFKYFIAGSNNDASPILLVGRHHEHSPFWWEGPDGKRILMWYSRMYTQVASLFGMPPDLELGAESLPIFLQMYDHPGYPSDATIVYGTQPENTDLFPQQASFVADWNSKYVYPRLDYSSFSEALGHIVGNSQDSLPVIRGDGGSFWESFNTADAKYVALERENEARALSAEKLSTISTVVDARVVPNQHDLHEMWKDIVLMDEHTWNSSRSVSQPRNRQTVEQQAEKESLATNARQLINRAAERSLTVLAEQVSAPPHSIIVFNSLNWTRSGLVEFDLDPGWKIVDAVTRQTVPYELRLTKLSRRVRFLAERVPGVGYKVYRLERESAKADESVEPTTSELENSYYRVTLDPSSGAIRSIYDKELRRELVDTSSPYRFGQYVYVTGADDLPNRLVVYRTPSPFPELTPHGAAAGRIVSIVRSPVGMVAKLESSATNTPSISSEIILFDKQKKIELTYNLRKAEIFRKEGVYFAFPLALDHPTFRYETQTTSIDPSLDMLQGAGLETFSVQHWISARKGQASATIMPLDTPIVALGDIVRGTFPTQFEQRNGTLFSFAMSNYHYDNWPGGQGGEFRFRYVFTSGADAEPDALTRLGWEEATPLEIDEVTTQDKAVDVPRRLPAALSFVEVDRPDVLLQTWKLAEDGNGTILRFLGFGSQGGVVNVTIPLMQLKSAWLCTALEANRNAVPLKDSHRLAFEIHPHEIVTVRLQATSGTD